MYLIKLLFYTTQSTEYIAKAFITTLTLHNCHEHSWIEDIFVKMLIKVKMHAFTFDRLLPIIVRLAINPYFYL